ncbi:Yhi9 protein [Martiniozyma asiatica (nom. inval.)]|nr:Yhi9 protein [Martiniozyma asiatica]
MIESPFKQVDVFTSIPFNGNPVAVIMDASELTSEQMQKIANWTNLSETTFVLPANDSQADYRVRIFTPESELPFAGHPTIGTAFALLESGIIDAKDGNLIQECQAGLINLSVETDDAGKYSISFELPKPLINNLDLTQVEELEGILNCQLDRTLTPAIIDVGPRWIVAHAGDADKVLAAKPDFAQLAEYSNKLNATGVCLYGYWSSSPNKHIEVRAFAPACGVNEDPVCGSGNGSVASFMRHHGLILAEEKLKSTQGKALGRNGHINIQFSQGKILVGGNAVTCVEGKIRL